MDVRNFQLQMAASANHGSKSSTVKIRLADGTEYDVETVEWNSDSSTVDIIPIPLDPPVEPEPEVPPTEG